MLQKNVFIDCLPSPTHLFSGIAQGNIASEKNAASASFPKQAALQSLDKMYAVHNTGALQIIVPPIPRPDIVFLKQLGLSKKNATTDTYGFRQAFSSSAMWTANWAHATASSDTKDGALHISVANLAAFSHRYLEAGYIEAALRHLFQKNRKIQIHKPLPPAGELHDEGSANSIRLSNRTGTIGFYLYVFGRSSALSETHTYAARQTRLALESIARRHTTIDDRIYFMQQNPAAIDAGVFHNDVIAFGGGNTLICHEEAYADQKRHLDSIKERFYKLTKEELNIVEIPKSLLPLKQAVESYFFNSQLILDQNRPPQILLAEQCKPATEQFKQLSLILEKAIPGLQQSYVQLSESMKNGGGPACLRLAIPSTPDEIRGIPQQMILSESIYKNVRSAIIDLYPETFAIDDLWTHIDIAPIVRASEEIARLLDFHKPWKAFAQKIGLKKYVS